MKSENEIFLPRQQFSLDIVGDLVYVFGGCNFKQCFNDLIVYNVTNFCPNNCSGNGICRN